MEDQLVSFETAKLAKDKGLNISCKYGWISYFKDFNGKTKIDDDSELILDSLGNHHYMERPTQSLLQRWLREVHELNVYCIPYQFDEKKWMNNIASHFKPFIGSYEDALELGLKEALKLIK